MSEKIENIKRNVSIKDIASEAGFLINRSGFMPSIYKQEKTPSLKVYQNNSFYCFATGSGGSVIDFYSGLYGVDLATAIRDLKAIAGIDDQNIESQPIIQLAKRIEGKPKDFIGSLSEDERIYYEEVFGMTIENSNSEKMASTNAEKETRKMRLQSNVEIFEEFFRYATKNSRNEKALEYLTDKRKISVRAINRFGVFTFENYNQVSNHLKKKFTIDQLQRSGLFNDNGNLIFFKHRIIIPYLHNGRIVYLRGRFFDETGSAQTDQFKYLGIKNDGTDLNSPKRFFNSDILKKLEDDSLLYICEGEFDSIAFNDFGFSSIAIAGTGNLPRVEILKGLLRFSSIIAVDQDEAGTKLGKRIEEYFHKNKKAIQFFFIEKKDINDYIVGKYEKK